LKKHLLPLLKALLLQMLLHQLQMLQKSNKSI
jgi:hypothetical protein